PGRRKWVRHRRSHAMSTSLEVIPLNARDWIVDLFPISLQWLVHHLLTIALILTVFGLFFAFTTVAERKLLGRLQNRLGPNRAGVPKLSILPFHLKHRLW